MGWCSVSVDDHVVEPPGMFDRRLATKYVEYAPKFLISPNGTNVWSYKGEIHHEHRAQCGRPGRESRSTASS